MAGIKENVIAIKQFVQFVKKTSPTFVSRVLTEELIKMDKTREMVSAKTEEEYSKLKYSEAWKKVDDLTREAVKKAYAGNTDEASKKFAEALNVLDGGINDSDVAMHILKDIEKLQSNVRMEKEKSTEALISEIRRTCSF